MEKLNTIVYGLVSLVVIVLIVATVAIPVIEDAQTQQFSATNNSSYTYTVAVDSENVTITVGYTTGKIYVNGEEQHMVVMHDALKIWGSNFAISSTTGTNQNYFQYESDPSDPTTLFNVITSIKYENGTVTLTNQSNLTKTISDVEWLLYPSDNGTYAEYRNLNNETVRANVYVNNDSTIYIGTPGMNCNLFSGKPTDENMTELVETNNSSYLTSTLHLSMSANSNGLTYQFDSAPTITYTTSGDDVTTGSDYVYVPISYNYISNDDSVIISLLSIIPLLLLIVPVMIAARMLYNRRD